MYSYAISAARLFQPRSGSCRHLGGAARPAPAGGASPATPHGALHPRGPPHVGPGAVRTRRGACRPVQRTRGGRRKAANVACNGTLIPQMPSRSDADTRELSPMGATQRPYAANRPFAYAAMQTSQRRHAPQPHERPTTSSPPLAGDQGGLRRGRGNRHGAPAGRMRGGAPQICEILIIVEV
jgi:hypothetical protein